MIKLKYLKILKEKVCSLQNDRAFLVYMQAFHSGQWIVDTGHWTVDTSVITTQAIG